MLKAIETTAIWTIDKIRAIESLMDHTAEHARKHLATMTLDKLVPLIFTLPYCRISNVIGYGIAKRQTASIHLQKLCDIGILDEHLVGREKVFVHVKLVSLLSSESNEYTAYGS